MASLLETIEFDKADVEYLANHLSPQQLRKEIHHAVIEESVCQNFGDKWEYYWAAFKVACESALDIQRTEEHKGAAVKGNLSIQGIKDSNDIVDVMGRYVTLKGRGNQYYGHCPLHDDKSPSLSVDREKQLWHCFSCNKGGDVIDFVRLVDNLDTRSAMKELARANRNG